MEPVGGTGESIEDTLDENHTIIDTYDGAALLLDEDLRGETVDLAEIDALPGRVRTFGEEPGGGIWYQDMDFEEFKMARLAFGLWEQCGPFNGPEEGVGAVPTEIAVEGQAAIGAYLRVGNGRPRTRDYVAHTMDVSKQTVSNYCNRVRWKPE